MLTQADIDRFYGDVRALGLKFPVKAISEATGFSKGSVSIYLSKKDEPSSFYPAPALKALIYNEF